MSQKRVEEVWKEYIFKGIENRTNYKLEISNYGRLRSYNRFHPEGKIIRGTKVEGYPMVRVTFTRPMLPKYQKIIEPIHQQVLELNAEIKKLKKTKTPQSKKQLESKTELRDKLVQKRKKLNAKYLRKSYKQVSVLTHKAVAELFLPPPQPNQKFIIHLDWNKENNYFENLKWASQEEVTKHQLANPQHAIKKFQESLLGIKKKPNTKMGKLTENEVLLIKKRLKKGDTLRSLAKRFGVSDMQIHRIKTGENWGHLKEVSELIKKK